MGNLATKLYGLAAEAVDLALERDELAKKLAEAEARVQALEARPTRWLYPEVRIGKNVSVPLDDVLYVCGAITSEAFMRHSLTFSPGYLAARRIREAIGEIYWEDPRLVEASDGDS